MTLSELIRSRRTIHDFATEHVDDQLVREALELSLWAPNHRLTFPWVYTWLGSEARRNLAALNAGMKGGPDTVKGQAAYRTVMSPSHLIGLGLRRRPAEPTVEHEDYATLACSVQIAALFLWQNGVASKWSTGGWTTNARAYELMGLDPESVRLEGCLLIGCQPLQPSAPERPGLDKVLRSVR